ncbi:alpha/beta hydrolase [bacterium]|nr:alpha/beta hydrolase [bacterium]MDB4562802.1 alpha/beta hydrolase [Akkermansiaceae bacterium]
MKKSYRSVLSTSCFFIFLAAPFTAHAQDAEKTAPLWKKGIYHESVPQPTFKDVRYGEQHRNVLDFWQAPSEEPTPVVISIHGGGWNGGNKAQLDSFVNAKELLKAGISIVSIHYRFIKHCKDLDPPVLGPLTDAARAVQFVRSKADEWNIDKTRIAATGGSAGACTSLWLAYHDDLADPESKDPVARESTRLRCVAAIRAQTTLDPKQMKAWIPNSKYGAHAFGIKSFDQFLADRDSILPLINKYSPYALLDAEDPETYLFFTVAPAVGKEERDPTHSAVFGVELQKRCKKLGVRCELAYPGAKNVQHKNPTEYLIATLVDETNNRDEK